MIKEQVQSKLMNLRCKDRLFFVWLCAVRALPFLGVAGNFKYWEGHDDGVDQKQRHLFSVLKALDVVWSAYDAFKIGGPVAFSTAEAEAAAEDADAAADTAADVAADTYTHAAAAAAKAIVYAAESTAEIGSIYKAADAADAAVRAAEAAAVVIDLESILENDLAIIESKNWHNRRPSFIDNTEVYGDVRDNFQNALSEIYGDVWDDFQYALRELDCEYWGNWYTRVFDRGFKLNANDRKKIQTRLNVPDEIKKRGAASVARYVNSTGKLNK